MVEELWGFLEPGATDNFKKVVSEARRLGTKLNLRSCALLVSGQVEIPDEARAYLTDKVYVAETKSADSSESVFEAILPVVRRYQPRLIIFSSSSFGTDIAARLGARLHVGLCAGVTDIDLVDERLQARKPIYEGKAHAILGWSGDKPYLATMDLSVLDAVPSKSTAKPEVVREQVEPGPPRAEFLGRWKVKPEAVDISEAEVVLGVGNGVATQEAMSQVEHLAKLLGASVGGSRIARYKGLVTEERQVGISGKQLSALVYLALGISGAPYHMMGIRDVKHIIAVNHDNMAKIFRNCELGIVADLREVVPKLTELARHGEVL